MAGYNRVVILGNLTRDPELKQLPSGTSICKLGIALNRSYRNRQSGELVQDVCFVDVDVWGSQAESCNKYLVKGRPVLIEGRLKFDTWQDTEGNTRSKHSITADSVQFLSFSQESVADDQVEAATTTPEAQPLTETQKEEIPKKGARVSNKKLDEKPFEDDLPF